MKVKIYIDALLTRSQRCIGVYIGNTPRSLLLQDFREKICINMPYYLSKHSSIAFEDLIAYAASVQPIRKTAKMYSEINHRTIVTNRVAINTETSPLTSLQTKNDALLAATSSGLYLQNTTSLHVISPPINVRVWTKANTAASACYRKVILCRAMRRRTATLCLHMHASVCLKLARVACPTIWREQSASLVEQQAIDA